MEVLKALLVLEMKYNSVSGLLNKPQHFCRLITVAFSVLIMKLVNVVFKASVGIVVAFIGVVEEITRST